MDQQKLINEIDIKEQITAEEFVGFVIATHGDSYLSDQQFRALISALVRKYSIFIKKSLDV